MSLVVSWASIRWQENRAHTWTEEELTPDVSETGTCAYPLRIDAQVTTGLITIHQTHSYSHMDAHYNSSPCGTACANIESLYTLRSPRRIDAQNTTR